MKTTQRFYLAFACLLLAGATLSRADLQNAAFMTPATATNTVSGGTADKAVNENGAANDWWHSVADTVDPWWMTDLGAEISVDSIVIRARSGFNERIRDCSLTLYPTSDATGTPSYSNVIKVLSGIDQTFVLPAGTYGRSVLINYAGSNTVNLTEVTVYSENLGRGKPATMSTTYGGGSGPEKTVDGVRPANFPNIAHSDGGDANPWLKVDLQGVCAIDSLRLWNRTSNQERMTDYNVQVLAGDDATVLYDYKLGHGALINPTNVLGSPTVITVDLHGDAVEGRYVKLIRELPAGADNVLQLSEVEIFGSTLVENRAATGVASHSATLNGYVNGTNTNTSVTVYWGADDKGTNWAQWAATHTLGVLGTGAVSTAIGGLSLDATYYFRFQASNATGDGYAPTSGRLRTIPASSGLVAWYSAAALELTNAASVTEWRDNSPDGLYNLTQGSAAGRPAFRTNVFNGQPAVHFNGTNSLWAGSLQENWPRDSTTIFFVTRADTIRGNEFYRADPNDNTDRFLSHYAYVNGNTYFDFGNISGGGRLQWPNNNVTSLNVVCYWQQAGVGQRAYRNGTLLNADQNTSAFSVNGYRWLLGNGYHGDIADMLVYNRALNSFEKGAVEYSLAEKYGVALSSATLDNADGAAPIAEATATLNGNLYTTDGGQSTVVKVFYGSGDGGATFGAWDSTNDFGAVTEPQAFDLPLAGLQSAQTVYYRFYASNAVSGGVWADSTAVFKTDFSEAPGDIQLWLAADTIPGLTNGQAVATWPDLSGNARHAVQDNPAAQPQFLINVAGGEPVVYNGTNGATLTLTMPLDPMGKTIVIVHRQAASQTAWTTALGGNLHTTLDNGMFGLVRAGGAVRVNSNVSSKEFSVNFLQMVSGDYRLWANGGPFGPDTRAPLFTSLTAVGSNFQGDFAEIIVFNGTLDEAGRREVGRYLAEKYDIAAAHGKHELPASAADPVIWYDADSEISLTNGQAIAALQDFSGNGNRAVSQATASFPTYVTNAAVAFGGKPAVRFSGSNDNWFAFTERADIRTVFWVIKEDADVAGGPRFLLGDDNTYHFHRTDPPNRFFWHGAHTHLNIRNGRTTIDGEWVNGLQANVPTTPSILAVRTIGNVNASRLMNDRGMAGRTWDGDLAELLVYNRPLSDHEMAQVGHYLEEKYALATDYALVDNANGATNVTLDTAFVNGRLNSAAGGSTTVKVLWGTTDGGASFGAWDGTNTFATTSTPREFTWQVGGLTPATVYYYRFYASNGAGQVWADAPAVFETLFGAATNGLQLWLDAQTIVGTNGAPVRRWIDQSGNALDAAQFASANQPALVHSAVNGRSAVSFDGAQFLDTAVLPGTWPTNAATVFVVTRSDNMSQQSWALMAVPDSNVNRFNIHIPWSNNVYWDFGSIVGNVGRVYCPHDGGTAWNVWHFSRGAEGMRIERNGVPRIRRDGGDTFSLGSQWLRLGAALQGDIAEVLVYNRELSPLEERQVGLHLQDRYAAGAAYSAVDNSMGADPVAQTTATLNGNLVAVDEADPATVAVYWGAADGGTNTDSWAQTNTFGSFTAPTAFTLSVSNLMPTTTYYYRFRGETGTATKWATETAAFRTHGHPVTDGLQLWLDARSVTGVTNGGAVAELHDWSGRGAHAMQTNALLRPSWQTNALNGDPVVHFSGGSNVLDGALGVTAKSILIVCKVETGAVNLTGVFCQRNADAQNIRSQSATQWRTPPITANPADFCYDGAVIVNGQSGSTHNNQYHLLHEVSAGTPSFDYRLSQPLYSRYFKGDVAEVLIYNRALTVAEQYELGAYIENRYGITIDYPVVDVTGVGAVASTEATVNGGLAVSNATVRLYYGPVDGVFDPGGWGFSALATNQGIGDLAVMATGLSSETTYYARYYATNSESFGWSPNVVEFYTQPNLPVRDGMSLWYTANVLSSDHAGEQRVASWPDISGNGRHGTANALGSPVFKPGIANGLPVVSFDGGTNTFFTFPRLDDIRTVFWVIREDADATFPRFLLGSEGIGNIFHFHRDPTVARYMWNANAHLNVRDGVTMLNGEGVNGMARAVPTDRLAVISLRTTGNVTANAFVSDRLSQGVTPARTWDGDLAELIIYSRALSDEEELEVGKYLARRYGLETKYTPSGTLLLVR